MSDGELQFLFNAILGALAAAVGWVLQGVRQSIADLRDTDAALSKTVNEIHVMVAGNYVRRDELERLVTRLEAKLDEIMRTSCERAQNENVRPRP